MIDVKQALIDPGSVFHNPEEILKNPDLSRELKIKILRQWEYDERELEVAEEENMGSNKKFQPHILDAILKALIALGAEHHHQQSVPTKHGGND